MGDFDVENIDYIALLILHSKKNYWPRLDDISEMVINPSAIHQMISESIRIFWGFFGTPSIGYTLAVALDRVDGGWVP